MSYRLRNCMAALIPLLMLSVVAPTFADAKSATIRNIPPTPHFAPDGTSPADLAAAIKIAADGLHWRIIGEVPGVIQASLLIRTHTAVVTIRYDESNYWIDYQDSVNLGYSPNDMRRNGPSPRIVKGPRIHRNYNLWVDQLAKRIAIQTRTPPRTNQARAADPVMIADELEKLDVLRERGVITQEEFDQQKMKLLAQ
jgi:hypothetical protein